MHTSKRTSTNKILALLALGAAFSLGLTGCDSSVPEAADSSSPVAARDHDPTQHLQLAKIDADVIHERAACSTDDGEGSDLSCAADIEIGQIDFNQGVGNQLMISGEWIEGNGIEGDEDVADERDTIVVRNRPGLMVAAWETPADWSSREITARLVLSGAVEKVYLDTKTVSGNSGAMSGAASTFNWVVEGEDIQPGVKMTVDLREASGSGSEDVNRWPSEARSLRVPANPMRLDVTVVAIDNTDPSCAYQPDAYADTYMEKYTDVLNQWNPVGDLRVEAYDGPTISANAPVECFFGTEADNGILWRTYMARQEQNVHANHIYYAAVDTCSGGMPGTECSGAGGMAWDWGFVAAGVWLGPDSDFYSFNYITAAHEVGHAEGRPHMPGGGADSPDPTYPNADGSLDTWGYGIVDGWIAEGYGKNWDFMSYNYGLAWSSMHTWVRNVRYIAAYQNWDRGPIGQQDYDMVKGYGDSDKRRALRDSDTMLIRVTSPSGKESYKAIEGGFEPELANTNKVVRVVTSGGRQVDAPVYESNRDGVGYMAVRLPEELDDIREIVDLSADIGGGARGSKLVDVNNIARYIPGETEL